MKIITDVRTVSFVLADQEAISAGCALARTMQPYTDFMSLYCQGGSGYRTLYLDELDPADIELSMDMNDALFEMSEEFALLCENYPSQGELTATCRILKADGNPTFLLTISTAC